MKFLIKVSVLSLLILLPQTTKANGGPTFNRILYVSPGIQIGYNPEKGFFYSGQVTIGYVPGVPPVGLAPGVPPVIPGFTIGLRKYKEQVMAFTDVQLSFFVVGIGVGYAWIKSSNESSEGYRAKLWGGMLINATYDFYKIPDSEITHNLGLIGVLPIPLLSLARSRGSFGI